MCNNDVCPGKVYKNIRKGSEKIENIRPQFPEMVGRNYFAWIIRGLHKIAEPVKTYGRSSNVAHSLPEDGAYEQKTSFPSRRGSRRHGK